MQLECILESKSISDDSQESVSDLVPNITLGEMIQTIKSFWIKVQRMYVDRKGFTPLSFPLASQQLQHYVSGEWGGSAVVMETPVCGKQSKHDRTEFTDSR